MFAAISEGLSLFAAVFVVLYAAGNTTMMYNRFKNQQRQIDELKKELQQIKNVSETQS
jgi:cell division protein FtsB